MTHSLCETCLASIFVINIKNVWKTLVKIVLSTLIFSTSFYYPEGQWEMCKIRFCLLSHYLLFAHVCHQEDVQGTDVISTNPHCRHLCPDFFLSALVFTGTAVCHKHHFFFFSCFFFHLARHCDDVIMRVHNFNGFFIKSINIKK